MPQLLIMPVGNARVEKAIDEQDKTIGVTISLLILPQDFESLPETFRESAHRVYAEARSR